MRYRPTHGLQHGGAVAAVPVAAAHLGLGWAESLGRDIARESAGTKRSGKAAPPRRSWSEAFASGVRGSEQGHASQRVTRAVAALPPLPSESEGDE